MIFTKSHEAAKRGVTSYQAPGVNGTIYLSKGILNGTHPETIDVSGDFPTAAPKAAKVAETPEARKARLAELKAKNASLTPAQKAEAKAERARKQLAAAEKAIAKANAAPAGDSASA